MVLLSIESEPSTTIGTASIIAHQDGSEMRMIKENLLLCTDKQVLSSVLLLQYYYNIYFKKYVHFNN